MAMRFPWKLFFGLVVVAVFGSAGAVFGVVQWIGRDLPTPDQLVAVRPPVKTLVFDARGRVDFDGLRKSRKRLR